MAADDAAHATRRVRAVDRADRRRPLARRSHAAAHPGSAPHRRDRDPRPARPPARGLGREFLAVPPLRFRRAGAARRLAPLGARRPSLCARAGMGGRAYGLDLARPLAFDGLRLQGSRATPSSNACWSSPSRWRRFLVEGGERVGIPGLMRPSASRNVIDKMAQAIIHDTAERASLPPSFAPSPLAEVVVLSDLWRPIREVTRPSAQLSASGAQGHVVQIVDPAEETFPYSGRDRIRRAGGRRHHHRRPRRKLAQRLRRARRAATARKSAPRPTSSAGASPSTAPSRPPPNCCWRCMRAWGCSQGNGARLNRQSGASA